ncbi:MAG: hypothetical protein L3K05_05585 [Thermoplasmata archaeon]|nr:hypothetical protein [Thermoplasmata archaeon]
MATAVRPVLDHPALLVEPEGRRAERWVVVADLHLGLAGMEGSRGVPVATTASEMADRLLTVCRVARSNRVVVAGDVKHAIVGTPRPLRPEIFRFFSTLLSEGIGVEIVLGNHDPGLVPHLPREVVAHSALGIVRDGIGIFHGHRWPSAKVLRASRLVAGHLHPGYRLAPSADRTTGKERCWVRVEFPPSAPPRRRRTHLIRARELIVLPAFNPLAGAEALNREKPRRGRSFLFQRFLAGGEARAYLMDGTDLGPLLTPPAPRRSATPRRAAPAP